MSEIFYRHDHPHSNGRRANGGYLFYICSIGIICCLSFVVNLRNPIQQVRKDIKANFDYQNEAITITPSDGSILHIKKEVKGDSSDDNGGEVKNLEKQVLRAPLSPPLPTVTSHNTATSVITNSSNISLLSQKEKNVIFVHFHKAGGTSIVQKFKGQRYYFWQYNSNGNPNRIIGFDPTRRNKTIFERIHFWNHAPKQFHSFIIEGQIQQHQQHLNGGENQYIKPLFIATEWNYFGEKYFYTKHDRKTKKLGKKLQHQQ